MSLSCPNYTEAQDPGVTASGLVQDVPVISHSCQGRVSLAVVAPAAPQGCGLLVLWVSFIEARPLGAPVTPTKTRLPAKCFPRAPDSDEEGQLALSGCGQATSRLL